MTALNCGGYTMRHSDTSVGPCNTFNIVDDNGGDLVSGDVVHLFLNGYYASVPDGGGGPYSYVFVNATSAGSAESFVLQKVNGSGRILNGDVVALRSLTGFYVTPQPTDLVTCNATALSYSETFVFAVQ